MRQDGIHREQSFNYQRFFLDFYLMVIILLKKNGMNIPRIIMEQTEKMLEFYLWALRPGNSSPNYGDQDSSRAIYYGPWAIHDYSGLLALGAIIFNRGDFKCSAKEITPDIPIMLGTSGLDKFRLLKEEKLSSTSRYFSEGYFIDRDNVLPNSNFMLYDCGLLGQ